MAQIIVERSHNLGRDAAREKADELAARLAREFGVSCQWQGDVLAVRRSGADGRIEVREDSVKVLLNLGLLLSAMGSSIQGQIERALDKALASTAAQGHVALRLAVRGGSGRSAAGARCPAGPVRCWRAPSRHWRWRFAGKCHAR